MLEDYVKCWKYSVKIFSEHFNLPTKKDEPVTIEHIKNSQSRLLGYNNIIDFDIYVMLFFAALILPLIFFPKKLVLGRKEGLIILLFYSFYLYNLFY